MTTNRRLPADKIDYWLRLVSFPFRIYILGIVLACGCGTGPTSGSSNQAELKEKVLASDLIVVARIKTWYGSHLINTVLDDPRVIWGRTETNTTLVVLQMPTALFLSGGRDTQWIFFLRKTMDTRDGFEYHRLVGGNEDTNGMQIATDEQVQTVIHLVKQLKKTPGK